MINECYDFMREQGVDIMWNAVVLKIAYGKLGKDWTPLLSSNIRG